ALGHHRGTGEGQQVSLPDRSAHSLRLSAVSPAAWRRVLDRLLHPHGRAGAFPVTPFEEHVSAALFPQRVAAALLSLLGAVALLLAALGLYGVLAFAVGQREHEFGIRIALGAQSVQVLGMVVRQGMWLTLTGLVAG